MNNSNNYNYIDIKYDSKLIYKNNQMILSTSILLW